MSAQWTEAQRLQALERAKGSLRLEGIDLTPEQVALLERDAREELTDDEFLQLALGLMKDRKPNKA